jgi:photosystem II stability/assembly factor-like uncharacterized protein
VTPLEKDNQRLGARSASAVPWYRRWRGEIPALAAVAVVVVFISNRRPANAEPRSDRLVVTAEEESPHALNMAAPTLVPVGAKSGAIDGTVAGNALDSNTGYTTEAGVLATVSPSHRSVTWLVGKHGAIRRLDAHGGVHVQRSGVSADLVAGAAPSASVCWIVGNNGTVIRTTDGDHWAQVPAPTTENFVAVSSDSANHATVTTAGGKSFVTSDGGATWHQQ